MKQIILIGGTGIVGSATALVALERGFRVVAIGLHLNPELPPQVEQIICNRNEREHFRQCVMLAAKGKRWDIVFDVIASNQRDAQQTIEIFGTSARRLFFLSTTLVYSRREEYSSPIRSSHPRAVKGELGGYVDCKVGMEEYISIHKNIPWTILRPYHILGKGSLLGCIPDHNRDPHLLERIRVGRALELCHGGNIPFNIVHPKDIGVVVLAASLSAKTLQGAYNCLNPEAVLAYEYYQEIAQQLGQMLRVREKTYRQVWEEHRGWELTSLPHLYDVSDLLADVGLVPKISYRECIRDALSVPWKEDTNVETIPVHNRMTLLPRPRPIPWLMNNDE